MTYNTLCYEPTSSLIHELVKLRANASYI